MPSKPDPQQTHRIDDAISDALLHGRTALSEAVLAARSLLDASSIALYGVAASAEARPGQTPTEGQDTLQRMSAALTDLAEALTSESGADELAEQIRERITDVLLVAMDGEIHRWEARSRRDPEARAVLRVFLGLREVLYELGLRRSGASSPSAASTPPTTASAPPTTASTAASATASTPSGHPAPQRPAASASSMRDEAPQSESPPIRPRVQRIVVDG